MPEGTKAKSGQRESGSKGSARPTDALTLLRKDHRTVKGLFRQFERAQRSKRKIVGEIERELETHATIEEEIFYPAVQSEVAQAEDLVHEAIEEHRVVRNLLSEITVLEPDDEQYDAKVKVLQENVEHHIEEEEGEMFPKVASALAETRLLELGREMQARKEVLGQSTLSRVISGVSNLIFGNGDEQGEESAETAGEAGRRRGQGASTASVRGRRGAQPARGRAAHGASGTRDSARERGEGATPSGRATGARARARQGARGKAKSARAKARGGRGQAGSTAGNVRSRARGKGGRMSGAQAKRQAAAKRLAARASGRKQAPAGKKRAAKPSRGARGRSAQSR
jgi:hemerythrin superfamily protein